MTLEFDLTSEAVISSVLATQYMAWKFERVGAMSNLNVSLEVGEFDGLGVTFCLGTAVVSRISIVTSFVFCKVAHIFIMFILRVTPMKPAKILIQLQMRPTCPSSHSRTINALVQSN